MPRRSTAAQIAFARIYIGDDPEEKGEQLPLLTSVEEALVESIQPGTTVTRYNRTWHMARYDRDDDVIVGRIGFDVETSPAWDESINDFRPVRPAQLAPFALDLRQKRVAFQLRGAAIKPWTFQGNFEALLNEPGKYQWSVRLEGVAQPPWEEWRERVERITEVSATMLRPNPHYPSDEIEHLFEEAKLASATLGARGDNIDPEGSILRDAIAHVLNGYGRLRAKGVRVEGGEAKPDQWRSDDADAGIKRKSIPLDPETGELRTEDLRASLEDDEADDQ